MRIVISALAVAAMAMPASAGAQYRQGYYELDKIENEYREKFAKERRDCNEKQHEAKNRSEWIKAKHECREKLADVERDFRKKMWEERQKLHEVRFHHDDD